MKRTMLLSRSSLHSIFVSITLLAGALLGARPAAGQGCSLYPIALSTDSLAGAVPDTILLDIWNGSQPGNFGWLTWTGDQGEPTLVDSLTQPGDSFSFINPDDANDHVVSAGDWVSGRPGVSNGKHVRAALDALKTVEIIVPVWDQARGQGANTAYHVVAFARVQIISYHLPSQNTITVKFLDYADCSGGGGTSLPAGSTLFPTTLSSWN
jgi:hypothetical protein